MMNGEKVAKFIELAGQSIGTQMHTGSAEVRALGAQLLLSEVLEYVVHGLGVIPSFNGVPITKPNDLQYSASSDPSLIDMVDGLADTAYTMYWNAITFGVPVDKAFELVCDNNLEKFIYLDSWSRGECSLQRSEWHLDRNIQWPTEVESVTVIHTKGGYYAVGKDKNGKVRKPSSYKPVELSHLVVGTVL